MTNKKEPKLTGNEEDKHNKFYLKNISIRWRLIGGFAFLCMLTLLTAGGGYYAQNQLGKSLIDTTKVISIANKQQKILSQQLSVIRTVTNDIHFANNIKAINSHLEKLTAITSDSGQVLSLISFVRNKLAIEKSNLIAYQEKLSRLAVELRDDFSVISENVISLVDSLTFEVKVNTASSFSSSKQLLDKNRYIINNQVSLLASSAKDTLSVLQKEIAIEKSIMLLGLQSKDLLLVKRLNELKYIEIDISDTFDRLRGNLTGFFEGDSAVDFLARLDRVKTIVNTLIDEKERELKNGVETLDEIKLSNIYEKINSEFEQLEEYSSAVFDTINFEVEVNVNEVEENIGAQVASAQNSIKIGLEELTNTTEKSLETVSLVLQIKSVALEIEKLVKEVLLSKKIKQTRYALVDITEYIDQALVGLSSLPESDASNHIISVLSSLRVKLPTLIKLKNRELVSAENISKMFIASTGNESSSLYDLIELLDENIKNTAINLEEEVQSALLESNKNTVFWKNVQVLLGIISFLFASVVGVVIFYSISRPLIEFKVTMAELIKGNFRYKCRYQAKDEIGVMAKSIQDLFKDKISSVIRNAKQLAVRQKNQADGFAKSFNVIASSSEYLKSQSSEISNSSNVMATNVSSVAEAMVSTSNNIGEVNISIDKIVDLLKDLDDLSKFSDSEVDELAQILKNIFSNIHKVTQQINQYSNDINKINALSEHSSQAATRSQSSVQLTLDVLNELEDVTEEIFSFIDKISEISTQSNVLSLNAAIEACQIEEGSGGFRVVAEEMKKLAIQTQNANARLASLVKVAQTRLQSVMDNCENSFERTKEVNENNLQIAKLLMQQAATVSDVSTNIESISSSCSNADTITDRVTSNFKKISKSIENNFLATKTMSENASECEKHIVSIVELIKKSSEEASRVNTNIKNVNKEIIVIDSNVVENQKASRELYNASKELEGLMAFFKEDN
ncbi:methyl-accepting chemotaxis protein [Spartinivicinus poritis]|uniref:Methyl-accepting chemotaxis protein n=1 Tax=Spartinivicinus poritis TaxID=2994640 RepID=A0ABT5UG06_9GAMM|nr:methyl-accepting chemotaxis protein [Spartinivicinus sp. A2-2]MDE1464009.1 methyl-accepting chemotaxis protein [Spartinivicinus sp. A2-2]